MTEETHTSGRRQPEEGLEWLLEELDNLVALAEAKRLHLTATDLRFARRSAEVELRTIHKTDDPGMS